MSLVNPANGHAPQNLFTCLSAPFLHPQHSTCGISFPSPQRLFIRRRQMAFGGPERQNAIPTAAEWMLPGQSGSRYGGRLAGGSLVTERLAAEAREFRRLFANDCSDVSMDDGGGLLYGGCRP